MASDLLIYGAYGYTGELIARGAVARGRRPVLAGRDGERLGALAAELGCPARAFGLDDPRAVAAGLAGVGVVLHCAGPFLHTWRPMAEGCLAAGAHYLDITGEIGVFEGLAARHRAAADAGVMLLPGVGFDVVPTDCLAAHLAARLPAATQLALGFQAGGRPSRGTAATMIEYLGQAGAVRRRGRIVAVPPAFAVRDIDFGRGVRRAMTIPWGDVATAYHSTGIPNVEVYVPASPALLRAARAGRWLAPLLRRRTVKALLARRLRYRPPGPDPDERARTRSYVWGEVRDDAGGRAVSRLVTPNGYTLTADAALAAVDKVDAGVAAAGFTTPSRLFGADFVLGLPGVSRHDE